MKIFVKTLKGSHFEIEVKPEDTVTNVKKNIETVQGTDVYPAEQLMVIHQGKVLKDTTTLEENGVSENSFIVVMLKKNIVSSTGTSTSVAAPVAQVLPSSALPSATSQAPAPAVTLTQTAPEPTPTAVPLASSDADAYGQAVSNLAAGSNLECIIQEILGMGGGCWDRDTVIHALRAAFNNPERAVEYLYSGIPEQAEAPPVARAPASAQAMSPIALAQQPEAVPSGGPNANPLDLFSQGLSNIGANASVGTLDFLHNNQQFQALRAMVEANPQVLQPLLQELGWQNPNLMRLIQEHQPDFFQLINEPVEGEGNILEEFASAMPQGVTITAEDREAIERLEAMGFERSIVLEVFFACNKNEELAANYLLDHMNEFEE